MSQLNPFEIKSLINSLIQQNVNEISVEDISVLDEQADKRTIVKLLYKELYNLKTDEASVLCFLLERYADKEELVKKLWELLRNNVVPNNVKIVALNFLRGLDSSWEIDAEDEILNEEIIDAETAKLLDNAVINPEVQIDFLDFLTSVSSNDKLILIDSLSKDYSGDALANILIPVFLSQPDSDVGMKALEILGESRSQLAFHALNSSVDFVDEKVLPYLKKSLSILKIAGIREDNSKEFYKKVLSDSKPYRCCITYPDGHGNVAMVFTRITDDNRVRFMAVVADDYHGIRDCFGFYDISQFECDKIIERFYKDEKEIEITPVQLKSIMLYFEKISKSGANNWLLPYEYVCWKNTLSDIEYEAVDEVLAENLKSEKLSSEKMEIIFDMPFMKRWFLDPHYSDEFENVLEIKDLNFDKTVDKNIDYVFYDEEKLIWSKRLLFVAYMMLIQGDKTLANFVYNLYFDEEAKREFYKYILKRSIYEYYVALKFSTELNDGRYTLKELDNIIAHIEDLWVCTK